PCPQQVCSTQPPRVSWLAMRRHTAAAIVMRSPELGRTSTTIREMGGEDAVNAQPATDTPHEIVRAHRSFNSSHIRQGADRTGTTITGATQVQPAVVVLVSNGTVVVGTELWGSHSAGQRAKSRGTRPGVTGVP